MGSFFLVWESVCNFWSGKPQNGLKGFPSVSSSCLHHLSGQFEVKISRILRQELLSNLDALRRPTNQLIDDPSEAGIGAGSHNTGRSSLPGFCYGIAGNKKERIDCRKCCLQPEVSGPMTARGLEIVPPPSFYMGQAF